MKSSKNLFIVTQAILGFIIIVLICLMLMENSGDSRDKISVVVSNSNDSQWAAFKYGLKRAAKDKDAKLVVVSSTGSLLTVEEEKRILEEEIENGADVLIVQPPVGEGAEEMLEEIARKVPVILVESGLQGEGDSGFPIVEPDNYMLGKSLAEELLKDYNGNVEGKTFGILLETEDSEAVMERKEGFCDALNDAAEGVIWTASSPSEESGDAVGNKFPVDFVIALDNSSFTKAGEASAARDLHGALVYGIGNSMEAVYYLDTGSAECLIVPDEFGVGYQSLTEAVDNLTFHFDRKRGQTLSYAVLRRETLFSEENQELIFTMSQ